MFTPIRDVVIVKKLDDNERTKGGLFIPGTVDSRAISHGIVIAAGDGILTESGNVVELKVKAGDKVVYGKTGCLDIQIEGEDFVMMREANILGIE
jgi:chaperonin GroES